MTTISRSKWRKRPPYRSIVVVLLFGVVLLSLGVWRGTFAGILWRVTEPVLHSRAFASSVIGSVTAQFYAKSALTRENEALKAALASSSLALLDRNLLAEENKELRERLGKAGATPHTTLASVIARPPASPYDTFIIDAGSDVGIAVGDLVFAGGASVIGSVSESYASTARVALFSSPGMVHTGLLRRQGGEAGDIPLTVSGQGGGTMRAEVPAGTKVSIADAVILTVNSLTLSGVVSHVERTEGNSFEVVYLHLPVNLFELRYVEVRRGEPL